MDWRSVTFDWNRARAFLVTAEEGSLSAAARALGMRQPTLGRQVTALEQELGVALIERVGRGVMLTPAGAEVVEHARAMGQAAMALSRVASGQSQNASGLVSITASETLSAHALPAILADLRQSHPGIQIEVVASNEMRDLRRREADIALRNQRPQDPELIARRLNSGRAHLYTSAEYLAKAGPFHSPAALARADFIGFVDNAAFLAGLNAAGVPVTADQFVLSSASHLVQWEMLKQGLGIGVMPETVGDSTPGVMRALPRLPAFEFDLWLVAHRELHSSRRVRIVFDHLAAALS